MKNNNDLKTIPDIISLFLHSLYECNLYVCLLQRIPKEKGKKFQIYFFLP